VGVLLIGAVIAGRAASERWNRLMSAIDAMDEREP
jgi:hypothetical protein